MELVLAFLGGCVGGAVSVLFLKIEPLRRAPRVPKMPDYGGPR